MRSRSDIRNLLHGSRPTTSPSLAVRFRAPSFFPPADIFGLGMEALLLIVGLTENFGLEKKKSLRLVGIVFAMLFALWLMERVSGLQAERLPDSAEQARPL